MSLIEWTHLLRALMWVIVFVFAWRYRSWSICSLALVSGTANYLLVSDDHSDAAGNAATLLFGVALPMIAFYLIDSARRRAGMVVPSRRELKAKRPVV